MDGAGRVVVGKIEWMGSRKGIAFGVMSRSNQERGMYRIIHAK